MIPKQAIEKAIEGGWHSELGLDGVNEYGAYFNDGLYHYRPQEIALDPSFWQALGKALGWTDYSEEHYTDSRDRTYSRTHKTWWLNASRFYDLILTGGDTDAFWRGVLECPSYVKGREVYDCNCGKCF